MADVFSGAPDGTCVANDDHLERSACSFREGAGSVDARLRLASGLGRGSYEAVEFDHRLALCLRSSQVCLRRNCALIRVSTPQKLWRGNRVTSGFRLICWPVVARGSSTSYRPAACRRRTRFLCGCRPMCSGGRYSCRRSPNRQRLAREFTSYQQNPTLVPSYEEIYRRYRELSGNAEIHRLMRGFD